MSSTPLANLDASFEHKVIEGVSVTVLLFHLRGNFYAVPFNETGATITYGDGKQYLVWKQESGSNIGDLTLSPSYLVYELDASGNRIGERLHGWVRNGRWEDC